MHIQTAVEKGYSNGRTYCQHYATNRSHCVKHVGDGRSDSYIGGETFSHYYRKGTMKTIGFVLIAGLVVLPSMVPTSLSAQDTKKARVDVRARVPNLGHTPVVPPPAPAPQLGPGESIDTTWQRYGEGPSGLWTVEFYQQGMGSIVGMMVQCPPGTRPIAASVENNRMTPFYISQSYPKSNGWYLQMRVIMSPPVGGQPLFPPRPYAFFVTVTCIDLQKWGNAMASP